jgi:hypothetical protein
MELNKLASAILNDILSGLRGITSNISLSVEQLEDDIIDERLTIIKEYALKGLLPVKDLVTSINCLEVDCKPIENCNLCNSNLNIRETKIPHVEIPQIVTDLGVDAIQYFGTVDRNTPFKIYTDISYQYHKYNRWLGRKPYIYIDTSPNENGMYDCYIFNAPLIKTLSIIAVFKDPRQLEQFTCCNAEEVSNMNFLTNDIKRRITEKKVRWYRNLAAPNLPNDQVAKA